MIRPLAFPKNQNAPRCSTVPDENWYRGMSRNIWDELSTPTATISTRPTQNHMGSMRDGSRSPRQLSWGLLKKDLSPVLWIFQTSTSTERNLITVSLQWSPLQLFKIIFNIFSIYLSRISPPQSIVSTNFVWYGRPLTMARGAAPWLQSTAEGAPCATQRPAGCGRGLRAAAAALARQAAEQRKIPWLQGLVGSWIACVAWGDKINCCICMLYISIVIVIVIYINIMINYV